MTSIRNVKAWLVGALLLALAVMVGMALQRELSGARPGDAGGATAPSFKLLPPRRAMAPEEEAYAAALWPIHSEVKDAAVKMTFAGLSYKLGESDLAALSGKISPLGARFGGVEQKLAALTAPQSLLAQHSDYLSAVRLYQQAASDMLRAVQEKRDEPLIEAQQKSEQAGRQLLIIGNRLWPTEYKPN